VVGLHFLAQSFFQDLKHLFIPSGPYKQFLDQTRKHYVLDTFDVLVLIPYFVILVILAIYGLHRYQLVYLYLRNRKSIPEPARFETLPSVTIQLPIYNEMFVVERLVESVAKINYPAELLEIQLLDDSTDETQHVARKAVESLRRQGVNIHYLHRDNRTGFKAGALEA